MIKLLASFALILVPVLALLIYGYRDANERRVEAVLDDQMQTAQAIAALVDASFDQAFALAWALSDEPLVQTLDPARLDPRLAPLAPHFPQFEAISVLDRDGDNVGSSLPFPAGSQRLGLAADRPYFEKVMDTGQPVVSEVLISRRTSRPTIIVAVPLQDAEKKTTGAIIVTLFLDTLAQRLEGVALGPEQNILLVDPAGTMAFYTAIKDLPWEKRDISEFGPVNASLQGTPTQVRSFAAPLSGVSSLGAFTPTPKYHWIVGVTIREDVALAPTSIALRDQLLGFGLVVMLSIAMALIASRTLVQPIRALAGHAASLGRGDLTRRANINTGDEMEELGKSFNEMAGRLEQMLNERQALAEVAEALVRERTLEGVAEVVVEQGQRVMRANTISLFLADLQQEELRLVAHRGLNAQTIAELSIVPFSATFQTAVAARTGRAQMCDDITTLDPELLRARQMVEREGQRSLFSQPLFAKGHLVGVVSVSRRVSQRLRQWEQEFLKEYADLCAIAVENARLYEEVQETLHLRDEFMSVAAHEMKTPITSIRGFAQVLLRSKATRPPEEQHALEVIERQTRRVARLAEDLLETISPSARPLEIQNVELVYLAEKMVRQAEQASEHHRLMVCRAGPVEVDADPEMIERVLLTLLDNAIRFSPEGGRIEVNVAAEEDTAMVSVRDHGQGIPKERQPHVFEPFYEPFPTGTPGYYGATGLGLYVVKTIIDRHRGRMWSESEEGQGSTFYFSLPIRQE